MDLLTRLVRRYYGLRDQPATAAEEYAPSYGDFVPTFWVVYRKPRNDQHAQRLYNHIRTVAWYLDALPFLTRAGLPVQIGFDEIVSAIPLYGDLLGFVLSLYQIFLSWIFGVPRLILGRMIINIVIDAFLGFIPFIGDFLDVFFKSNLRNLALLEEWLLQDDLAAQYRISLPPSDVFLPKLNRKGSRRSSTANSYPAGSQRASAERDPRAKYRNPLRTSRMEPEGLD